MPVEIRMSDQSLEEWVQSWRRSSSPDRRGAEIKDGTWGSAAEAQAKLQASRAEAAAFDELRFNPDLEDVREQIRQYWQHSAELRRTALEAVAYGPINVREFEDEDTELLSESAGKWHVGSRTIILSRNASHMTSDSIFIFELINASNEEFFKSVQAALEKGEFEAPHASVQSGGSGGQTPDIESAALQHARAVETIEWNTARRHHAIFGELALAGIPDLSGNKDVYGPAFKAPPDGGKAPWEDFEDYFTAQTQAGHNKDYIEHYKVSRAKGAEVDLDDFNFEIGDDFDFEIGTASISGLNPSSSDGRGRLAGSVEVQERPDASASPARVITPQFVRWLRELCGAQLS
jgi:hypothetical protein